MMVPGCKKYEYSNSNYLCGWWESTGREKLKPYAIITIVKIECPVGNFTQLRLMVFILSADFEKKSSCSLPEEAMLFVGQADCLPVQNLAKERLYECLSTLVAIVLVRAGFCS